MKLSFILIVAFIMSCGNISTNNNLTATLYSKFKMYSTEVNKNNLQSLYPKYFSKNILGSESINDTEVIDQLLFKKYMMRRFNYIENLSNNTGCLTVNGYDGDDKPIAFNLRYIFFEGDWLIDKIHVLFLTDDLKFTKIARCPSHYTNPTTN